jgi:fatty-acyl-CoA synthase
MAHLRLFRGLNAAPKRRFLALARRFARRTTRLMLVTEMIRRGARHHRDRVALVFGDRRLSYDEVDRLSNRLANTLIGRLGREPKSRVALLSDNSLLSIPTDFACAKARLARVPLNSRLSADEQQRMIEGVGADLLIYGPTQAARAHALAARMPGLHHLGLGCGEDLLQLARDAPDNDPRLSAEPDDTVLALYTSGTTGKLKAVEHSHASYGAVVANVLLNLVDPAPGEMILHAASLIHASGTFILPFWLRGGVAGILPGFDPPAYIAAIERWRPAALCLVPTMLQMLVEQPGIERVDMSSVETILYGASPMPRPLIERVLALWGPRFVQFYGQTEAPLAIACLGKAEHSLDHPERLISCGRPAIDCEVKLVDEQGDDAAEGEPGEIAVRAPFVMKRYLGDDALNAASFLPGGWLRTRDVGRFDEDGYLYLIERTSDMIVTGGYNVYPKEVEDVLAAHPAVIEAAVVGIPDDKWGEAVTAFVVLRDGTVEEEALLDHCRGQLAGYKVPKSVRFVAEIPRSAVGKPLRRALRDPFWEGRERRI